MNEIQDLTKGEWKTIDGIHIFIYNGIDFEDSIEIKEHYRRLQSCVDTYPEKYKSGRNYEIIDNYYYTFIVDKEDRKIKLKERKKY